MSRWVVSYIDNSRIVVTQGTLSLLAQSEAIIESISAAGGGGGKAAVYGAVSLNFINTDIASYIKDCSSPDSTLDTEKKLVNVQGDITLIALDKSSVSVIAGNVAGSGTASVGAAIAISYIGNGDLSSFDKYVENDEYTDEEASEEGGISESDYDYDDPGFTETSKVRVYIDNSTVTSTEGAILLKAAAENDISNITAGTAAGGKAGVQGSVSVNYLYSNVWVQVLNGSTLTADGDIVLEVLSEGSSIRSLAGAVAGGGNAGAGIAIAVNHIANSYLASVEGSQVISDNGDIILTAWNDCAIKTLSAAITWGGNLAVAGAVSANFIHNNVSAAVINSIAESNKIDATMVDDQYPGIRLTAKDSSSIESISGQVNASETVGIGAAAGYNTVGNTIKAYISDSSVVTSKTYITVKALSEAYIKTVVAGGGIGSVSINGSVAVNSIGSHVLAYIDSSQVISRKSIALLASDSSEIGAISGPVGGAYYASVGASVAVNYLGTSENPHLVHAYIFNSKVVSQEGGITLYADSDAIVKSISAAGGAAVYVAVNGAISVNYVYTSIGTFIKDCNGVTNGVIAFGDIKLDAIDRTAISVIAGSISGAGLGGGGAAVAIVFIGNGVLEGGDPAGNNYKVNNPGQESDSEEFDYNKPTFSDDNKVMAFIENSLVESEQGSVRITAKANSAIFNISAGAGVGGAAGLQGSVSVNYIYTGVTAYILNGTVEAGGDIVIQALTEKRTSIPKSALQVDSADGDVYGFDGGADDEGDADSLETQPNSPEKLTNIQSIAGAVAGGGGAGLGAAVAVNHVVNTYSAYVFNSTLKAGNDIIIEAHSLAGIETVSAAAAAGSGTFAAAGSVSLNFINNTILAYISSSEVTATDNIIIDAEDSSVIKSVSGQINFSGSAGLGAAAAYNEIANTIKAYVDMADATQSVLIAGEDILVRSQANATISSICASGSFGANFGGSATVVINMIDNTVSAYIADADVIAQGNLYILAQSLNETNSYGGSIGGGSVGIGAAVIVNIIENDTEAYIVGSSVKALGNGTALTIPFWDADGKKQSDQALNGLIIFAYNKEAITVYSGSAGVGQAGISGQVSTNIIKNATKAYIDSSTINRDGDKGKWVILRAIQDTGIQIYAGSLAAGLAAVGGAVDATYVTNNTSAYLKDSEVYAGNGVDVTAITGLRPLSGTNPAVIIAGESLSAMLSMAGAVSVVVTENINESLYFERKGIFLRFYQSTVKP